MESDLGRIDWGAPWFEPWRGVGERVAARWQSGANLPAALNEEAGAPVRFVDSAALAAGEAYESHVFLTRDCPTRESAHDFFNGLCWLRFPQTKTRLNELQAGEIAAAGVGSARGAVRDAITVFDENGAVLHAPPELWEALLARDWHKLFVELRPQWAHAHITLFGHALLEKLVAPRKEITAHVWCAPCPAAPSPEVDAWLAAQVTPGALATKPFAPLPLAGVPGWWPGNDNFSFYDDPLVFRPARRQNEKTTKQPVASRP